MAVIDQETEFLTDFDLHLFSEGTHSRLYQKLGAQLVTHNGVSGGHFAVWAPNAEQVSVVGDFNDWEEGANPLSPRGASGLWAGFVPGAENGTTYQYDLVSARQAHRIQRTDPFAFRQEGPPKPASVIWDLEYRWGDRNWMAQRAQRNQLTAPLAIYEVHLGSWMRVPEEGNRSLTYRELALKLAEYVLHLGFTHVELLPVMEQSWDELPEYQVTGYFAASCRYGTPQELMWLIDYLHQHNIGVILDWVPGHFAAAENGLRYFDGTHLYEHRPWRLGVPPEGDGFACDHSRPEVRSFLLSSACFWLDKYHADGLRLDAMASLLYLDYGHKSGEWLPSQSGGRENLEGVHFLRQLNAEISRSFPGAQTIAEEATGRPSVCRSVAEGGLGFTFKWDTEFTRNTLAYFAHDPYFRKFHHGNLTSRPLCAFNENFVLALAHDQVGRGQRSLLARMPGDEWQRFANLRLLLGYLYLQPGKKLIFMGSEFAQWSEWNPNASLDWHLCAYPAHGGMRRWVRDLNQLYARHPALHQTDTSAAGFEWVDAQDAEQSTLTWLRRDLDRREVLLAVCNFTPVVRRNFRVGVQHSGPWPELVNSDAREYGGSGQGNFGGVNSSPFSSHGLPHTLTLTLPPLALVVFKHGE